MTTNIDEHNNNITVDDIALKNGKYADVLWNKYESAF